MIEEYSVHRLTNIVVASERETEVTHTTTDMCPGQIGLDPFRRPDKVGGIAVVFLHTCCYSQHIGVEDDIQRIHPHLIHKQLVGSPGNFYTTFIAGGLSLLIETHHHHCSPVPFHVPGMFEELRLTFFQRDGVNDRLTLYALETSHNHLPVRRVDHNRNLGYIRFCGNHVEEIHHLRLRIKQAVIHIDIYHKCTVGNLFAGDTDGLVIVLFLDQAEELSGAGHITAFTNIYKM